MTAIVSEGRSCRPRDHLPTGFPAVVVLCGSSRFQEEHLQASKEETLAGKIIIPMGLYGHAEGMDMDGPVKRMLDELHLRKIDLADEVLVVAPVCRVCPACHSVWPHGRVRVEKCSCGQGIDDVEPIGYVGESTRREIVYAELQGKAVRYWGEDA